MSPRDATAGSEDWPMSHLKGVGGRGPWGRRRTLRGLGWAGATGSPTGRRRREGQPQGATGGGDEGRTQEGGRGNGRDPTKGEDGRGQASEGRQARAGRRGRRATAARTAGKDGGRATAGRGDGRQGRQRARTAGNGGRGQGQRASKGGWGHQGKQREGAEKAESWPTGSDGDGRPRAGGDPLQKGGAIEEEAKANTAKESGDKHRRRRPRAGATRTRLGGHPRHSTGGHSERGQATNRQDCRRKSGNEVRRERRRASEEGRQETTKCQPLPHLTPETNPPRPARPRTSTLNRNSQRLPRPHTPINPVQLANPSHHGRSIRVRRDPPSQLPQILAGFDPNDSRRSGN